MFPKSGTPSLKFISPGNPQPEEVGPAEGRKPEARSRLPILPNEAYDPPAVNSPKLGDAYEEALQPRRFRVAARPRAVRPGTLPRRPRLARPVDPRQTYSDGCLPHKPAPVHQAAHRGREK